MMTFLTIAFCWFGCMLAVMVGLKVQTIENRILSQLLPFLLYQLVFLWSMMIIHSLTYVEIIEFDEYFFIEELIRYGVYPFGAIALFLAIKGFRDSARMKNVYLAIASCLPFVIVGLYFAGYLVFYYVAVPVFVIVMARKLFVWKQNQKTSEQAME